MPPSSCIHSRNASENVSALAIVPRRATLLQLLLNDRWRNNAIRKAERDGRGKSLGDQNRDVPCPDVSSPCKSEKQVVEEPTYLHPLVIEGEHFWCSVRLEDADSINIGLVAEDVI